MFLNKTPLKGFHIQTIAFLKYRNETIQIYSNLIILALVKRVDTWFKGNREPESRRMHIHTKKNPVC